MLDTTSWISQRRFDEHLIAANRDPDAGRQLYEWNLSASGAFFELIALVEVAVRNAVDRILEPLEVPGTARVQQRKGWWFANSAFLKEGELDFHRTAVRHLGSRADNATRDKVLASMTFGLWEAVFGPNYENLFRSHLVYAFPNRPRSGFKRTSVHRNLVALKNLRNRIAHHQAIFDLPLEEKYEQAIDLLSWIDPALEQWAVKVSRVTQLLDERPQAAESIAVIVPAFRAWGLYNDLYAYVCQPGRFFRQVSHIGFYREGSVQREVPKIIERIDHVRWAPEEIQKRMDAGNADDKRIAELIRGARTLGWTDDEYQVFLLTRPDEEGRRHGHVTLGSELRNQRKGRGSAWVQRQRYAPVSALRSARTLGDLDQQ